MVSYYILWAACKVCYRAQVAWGDGHLTLKFGVLCVEIPLTIYYIYRFLTIFKETCHWWCYELWAACKVCYRAQVAWGDGHLTLKFGVLCVEIPLLLQCSIFKLFHSLLLNIVYTGRHKHRHTPADTHTLMSIVDKPQL